MNTDDKLRQLTMYADLLRREVCSILLMQGEIDRTEVQKLALEALDSVQALHDVIDSMKSPELEAT
jgi:hypothetical protein